MMSAIIAASCAAFNPGQGDYKIACNKAFEAGSIQSGIKQNVDDLERAANKKAESIVRKHLPDEAVGMIVAVVTIGTSKEIRLSTGKIPYIQSTALLIKRNSSLLTLSWNF